MKFKIKTKFADKHTGQIYQEGTVVDFSERRASEIKKAGDFIKAIEEPKKEEKAEEEEPKKAESKPKKSTAKKSAKK